MLTNHEETIKQKDNTIRSMKDEIKWITDRNLQPGKSPITSSNSTARGNTDNTLNSSVNSEMTNRNQM